MSSKLYSTLQPKGVIIRDPIQHTSSALSIRGHSIDPKDKGKGKMVEEAKPISAVQTAINMQMEQVVAYADSKIEFYDKWLEFRTKVFANKLKNKHTLKRFINLERTVLKAVKDVSIEHALERREYFYDLMREKKLSSICNTYVHLTTSATSSILGGWHLNLGNRTGP